MDTKIKKLLDSSKIKYKVIEHRKVYTAFTASETQHIKPSTVVKVVFVKLSKPSTHLLDHSKISTIDSMLVAVPAGKRIDLKKIAKSVNDDAAKSFKLIQKTNPKTKKPPFVTAKMANEKDIEKKLKTKVGLLHPFSQIFGLPMLFDKKLTKNKKLIVSAGSYTESLEISTKDYLKIMVGIQGSFTE